MRIVLGVLSLLVALAVVAIVARQQLKAAGSAIPYGANAAAATASATLPEQSRALQQQVRQDLEQALQQVPARASAADQ